MRKIKVLIILSAGFWAGIFSLAPRSVQADDNAVTSPAQVLNDEGYGNDDEEYYNSEDDQVNDSEAVGNADEEPSGPQENSSANRQ